MASAALCGVSLAAASSSTASSTFASVSPVQCFVRISSLSRRSRALSGRFSALEPLERLRSSPRRQFLTVCKLSEGDVLPPFSLKDQEGRMVSSTKFKNKPVVLYFYPADETPGCTKEACAFRDSYEKFKKAGAEVVGISADTPESHKAFAQKYKLPFTLLTDDGNKLRKEWGIPGDFFGTLPGRQTYVIDKQGVIRLIFNNQFQSEKHANETLNFLQTI